MKAVVTGAAGFIGTALVERLIAGGHEVIALARRPPLGAGGARAVSLRLGEPLPDPLLTGVDLMVHLAHDMTVGSLRRNVQGTRQWLDQANGAGVKSQVYVSSYSAHPASPSEYGRAKHELETYTVRLGGTVIRPGLVLGRGGAFGALTALVRRSAIVPVPGGELPVFLSELRDILKVMTSAECLKAGAVLNVFSPEPAALGRVLRAVSHAIGGRRAIVSIPAVVALPLLTLVSALHPALKSYRESLAALAASQSYGYHSSYAALGLIPRSLDAMVADALSTHAAPTR